MAPDEKVLSMFAVLRGVESRLLAFNYARMHQRCDRFLRTLISLSSSLRDAVRSAPPDYDIVGNAILVQGIYMQEAKQHEALAYADGHSSGTGILELVAQKMQALIDESGDFEVKLINNRRSLVSSRKIDVPQPDYCVVLSDMKNVPTALNYTVQMQDRYLYKELKDA